MSSSLIRKLCDRWDTDSPKIAITRAVSHAFPELQDIQARVNVRALASRRCATVKNATMVLDGTISSIGQGRYLIQLNRAHPESRRRFTCAHEIGHTFLFELEDCQSPKSRLRVQDGDLESSGRTREEEFLCNVAAAEILMPYRPFSRRARTLRPSAHSIVSLARFFGTSLWSTAHRFVEVSPVNLLVALWNYEPKSQTYRTGWVVRPGASRCREVFEVDSSLPIFRTFQSQEVFRGRKWTRLGGPLHQYFVDGIKLGASGNRRILTVFVFDRHAEQLLGRPVLESLESDQFSLFDSP